MIAHSSLRILVIEDYEDSRLALHRVLTGEGHRVRTAATGREGLEVFLSEEFDVAIFDLLLPDIHGNELLKIFKEKKPILAIALSGHHSEEDVESALAAGFLRHLPKPISLDELMQAINAVLKQRDAGE
jgi:CheY-like chemotaxis protein